jgi:hypothetical protein
MFAEVHDFATMHGSFVAPIRLGKSELTGERDIGRPLADGGGSARGRPSKPTKRERLGPVSSRGLSC